MKAFLRRRYLPGEHYQSELDPKLAKQAIARALARCECAKARATIAGMLVNKIHANK